MRTCEHQTVQAGQLPQYCQALAGDPTAAQQVQVKQPASCTGQGGQRLVAQLGQVSYRQ
jgi:hypothetical protein